MVNIEEFRQYVLAKNHAEETFPFGENTLVYKVRGKIFAIAYLRGEELKVNLKCDPDQAIVWRDSYPEVQPGWHMNKTHWNTVHLEGNLSKSILKQMIDHSYDLVRVGLPKKLRF